MEARVSAKSYNSAKQGCRTYDVLASYTHHESRTGVVSHSFDDAVLKHASVKAARASTKFTD